MKLADVRERAAYVEWAASGIFPQAFAQLIPQSHKAETTAAAPIVHQKTTPPVIPKQVSLQKELLVNKPTKDAPKTPALTDCLDPSAPVTKYKAYCRVEKQR